MEIYERKLIASSALFSGFTISIDITQIETLDDICVYFKKKLKEILTKYNFENLIIKLNESNFHIHTHTIESVLTSEKNEIIYICDHCN